MVLTTKENLKRYCSLSPRFAAAFTALAKLAEIPFKPGCHPVDGDNIFINALEYDTQIENGALMEAHKIYIDVMWIISGNEQIAISPLANATEITSPYDVSGDAVLTKIPANCTYLQMNPGSVCILFPEDAHAPGLSTAAPSHIQKLIAKVRVD